MIFCREIQSTEGRRMKVEIRANELTSKELQNQSSKKILENEARKNVVSGEELQDFRPTCPGDYGIGTRHCPPCCHQIPDCDNDYTTPHPSHYPPPTCCRCH
ncbi:hypothetical protein OWV82_010396 [Melia azedarach]|uniref:Uncharacterized protein n=1 Tax=Melia azedarach TaxID=155640 RepID=A0ACC1Y6A1_MELAZ|nr:hypothetical protein OWV82_010396 [Melia azedarach]